MCVNQSFSQKKKVQKNESQAVDIMEVTEVQAVDEVADVPYNVVSPVGRNYGRYAEEIINDNTKWVYDRYNPSGSKFGLSKNGTMILPVLFDKQSYNRVSDNNSFCLGIGSNYGLYNVEKEKWEIPLIYNSLSHLGNDIFVASAKSGYYGLVNRNNKTLVPFEWGSISVFEEFDNYYLIRDKKTSNMGIYSLLRDQFVIPCEYKSFDKVRNLNLYKVNNEKGYNLITIDNKPMLKNWYQELYVIYDSKNFIVKLNDKMGIIDEDENIIVPIEYKHISSSRYNDGSYLAINKLGKYGCIKSDGKTSLAFDYDFINANYTNGLISKKGDKCGMIQVNNGSPHEIVTCEYDNIIVDNESLIVEKNNKFGILDTFGKLIAACDYESIEKILFKNYSSNYLYIAQKNKKYILLDRSSRIITDQNYTSIAPVVAAGGDNYYYNSVRKSTFLLFKDKDKLGLLDMLGKEILDTKYDDIISEFNNAIIVKLKGKMGIYNLLTKIETTPCVYDQIIIDKTGNYGIIGSSIYALNLNDNTKSVKI
jgi:hypothetical protein